MLASTRFDASGDQLDYSLKLDAAPDGATAIRVTGCSVGPDPWGATPVPAETPPSGSTSVTVGTTRTLDIQTGITYQAIQAKAIAVGKSAIVWADTTPAHPANLDAAFVSQFLADFENVILPRERAIFGMESDQDNDGHISLVFSPLTYQSAVAFFTGCDLQSLVGCKTFEPRRVPVPDAARHDRAAVQHAERYQGNPRPRVLAPHQFQPQSTAKPAHGLAG